MSDLISRSELIKLINNKYIGLNDAVDLYHGGKFDCFKEIKLMIKKQPTAYDIDKVVAQFEEIRVKKTCNKEKCDTKELCRICVIDDAIEIVKGGGVDAGSI